MSIKTKLELFPNEIFMECFQYLNAPNIFKSFDQLNNRFHMLIRNIPLHLNFQHFKKCLFNEFCQTISTNPEMKENIISLQLSNEGTPGQIQSFLLLFPLNEFIHLRSLSLIDLKENNTEQVLPMLPFLSDLSCFSCTSPEYKILKIMPALSNSKIRILTVPNVNINSTSIYEILSLTSLTVSDCNLSDLCRLLKYVSMIKYLQILHFSDSQITDEELNFSTNAVHLKRLVVNHSKVKFQVLEVLLKRIPNLKIFSISVWGDMEMVDAHRWQHLIETSLPYLHIFKFSFSYLARNDYNEKLIKLQQFQTDFWHKQHHWYTNYNIEEFVVSIYTIPCIKNGYGLKYTKNRTSHSLTSHSNEFDSVKNLFLWRRAIRKDSLHYFRNVQSLTLTSEFDDDGDDETDDCDLSVTQIKFLHVIVNLSSIKHLKIEDYLHLTSSLLLKILQKLPNVSSLAINKRTLISFLKDRQLCKSLNKKIMTLDISTYCSNRYIKSNDIDLFCRTFSNLERLKCFIKNVDHLVLILTKCSKLSMINLIWISKQIHSWIQINASTLNVYLDFSSIKYGDENDM